jgi:hypothetical protein
MPLGQTATIARRPLFALKLPVLSGSIDAIEGVKMSFGNHWLYPRNLKWILLSFPNPIAGARQAADGD